MSNKTTVGELIAAFLEQCGVRTTFGVISIHNMPILDAINSRGKIRYVEAFEVSEYGAPLVVLGAPLTIDADAFKTASGDLEDVLRVICGKVHAYRQ